MHTTDIRTSWEVESKKTNFHKVAIRPTTLYAAETMCFTNKDAEKLKIFKRKIMRKIHEPKKINEEHYRRLTNQSKRHKIKSRE